MIEELAAESVRLLAIVETKAVLGDALYPEIVGHGADCEDEIVEPDRVRSDQLGAVVVEQRRDLDFTPVAIDAGEGATEEAIAPAMAVAAIADLVEIGVQRSGSDLVQQRLPDVGAVAFDQDDVVALAAIFRAELAGQLEPGRAASDDDDLRLSVCHSLDRTTRNQSTSAQPCGVAPRVASSLPSDLVKPITPALEAE